MRIEVTEIMETTKDESIYRLCESFLETMSGRAKNPGVWDGAPEEAIMAVLEHSSKNDVLARIVFTRELPKSLAREIAESKANDLVDESHASLVNLLEATILKYVATVK